MRRFALLVLATLLALSGLSLTPGKSDAGAPSVHVTVVQAVPGATVDVSVDGRGIASAAGVGDVLGPFGNPRDGSMNVIAHTEALAPDGSVQPSSIDSGSAGLVDGHVTTFDDRSGAAPFAVAPSALGVLAGAAGVVLRRRLRQSASGRLPG